jgi:uncharacterized membrane protein YfcA
MPDLTTNQWALAVIASLGVGFSKAGFPGMALLHVMIFAFLFGARDSTGIVLPMLIVGDLGAIGGFYRHTRWDHLRRTLPAACIGVLVGALLMRHLSDAAFAPILGWIILFFVVLHIWGTEPFSTDVGEKSGRDTFANKVKVTRPLFRAVVEKSSVILGLLAGVTTMLANAGGPVLTLYLLGMKVPKLELTATIAWFFFVLNVFKIPFSAGLGLITPATLALNAVLVPGIIVGLLIGRWVVHRVPQRLFNQLLLLFAALAALRLIGVL